MKTLKAKSRSEYSIEVPKQEKYMFLVRNFLDSILGLEKVNEKERDEVVLAVNEACDRLFAEGPVHANIKVDIGVKITPKKINVLLRHKNKEALNYDFKEMDEDSIVLEAVKRRIGGYLMEKSVDEVVYSSSHKKGHQLKIIKLRGK